MNTPNPNPSPELLPCPFCGGEAVISHVEAHDHTPMLKALLPQIEPAEDTYWPECGCGAAKEGCNSRSDAIAAWNTRALSPQTLPAPGEVERPISMKAWAGGDSAPDDWDGGPVKARNGKTVYTPAYWQHRPEPEWSGQWDIVAYTPILATVAAANDEGDWVLVPREITQAMLDATCATDADDRAMRAAWSELIRTAPKPLATSRSQHEGASS